MNFLIKLNTSCIDFDCRQKLDEIKRMEIEYQRNLVKQKKDHMIHVERNYWNPIHHSNSDTFEEEDLKKLLSKVRSLIDSKFYKRLDDNRIDLGNLSLINWTPGLPDGVHSNRPCLLVVSPSVR